MKRGRGGGHTILHLPKNALLFFPPALKQNVSMTFIFTCALFNVSHALPLKNHSFNVQQTGVNSQSRQKKRKGGKSLTAKQNKV